MTGIFGDMFDLDKDGKMNGFEHAMELTYLKEMKDVERKNMGPHRKGTNIGEFLPKKEK